MALNAYLKLKGQKQGDIKGSVTQKGREGKIMVIAASHDVLSPRDAASGLPTGKRMHKPFVITKVIALVIVKINLERVELPITYLGVRPSFNKVPVTIGPQPPPVNESTNPPNNPKILILRPDF